MNHALSSLAFNKLNIMFVETFFREFHPLRKFKIIAKRFK